MGQAADRIAPTVDAAAQSVYRGALGNEAILASTSATLEEEEE